MRKRNIGIVLSYVNTIVSMLCGFVLSTVLLRSLGDTEYGLYQTISSFATYLVMLEFGTGTAMSRGIVIYKNRKAENGANQTESCISTVWYMTVFLAGLILLVAAGFYVNIGNIYKETMTIDQIVYAKRLFVFIVGYLIFSYFRQAANGILLGMEQYTFASTITIIQTTVRTLILIFTMLFQPYAITIVTVDLVLSACSCTVTLLYCRRKYGIRFKIKNFRKEIIIEFFPMCFALLLQSFVNQANNNVDKFIISIQLSIESVAIYSVAQYVYSMFSSVVTIPITMYLPQVGRDMGKGLSGRELTDTFIQPCRLVSILGGTLLFGFLSVGRPFISLVYGKSKEAAWIYALIIIVPMFLNATNGILVNVLDVLNKRQVRSLILTATTVMNIILTVWMISFMGIIGAVVATAIATLLGQVFLMNYYYSRKVGIHVMYLFKEAYRGVIPYQLMAAIVTIAVTHFVQSDLVSLLFGGCLYVALSGTLIVYFGLNQKEKDMFTQLAKHVIK